MRKTLTALLAAVALIGLVAPTVQAAGAANRSMFAASKQPGGVQIIDDLAEHPGDIWFVDSGATHAADSAGAGRNVDLPFATLDYAISHANMAAGATIYVMPGHTEDIGTGESIDVDVAGIRIIGLGTGSKRPRFDYDAADSAFDIGANDCLIRNLTFRPGITSTLIGIDIESAVTGTTIEDCEFLIGEAAGTDEFVVTIDLKATNSDTTIRRNTFRTHATDASCTAAILMTAASTRVRIEDNVFIGNYSTAAIDDGAACTELLITGNKIKVKDGEPGIELHANTTGIIAYNLIESTTLADPDLAIVAADCSWFQNYVVVADGAAPELIGTSTESDAAIGSVFAVTKTVTKTGIVAAGIDLTGASSGTLLLEDCILQNDTTEIDSAGHAEVIEFYTDNVAGSESFMTIAASVLASEIRDLRDSTTGFRVVLESGKKVKVKATTEDVTSNGTCTVYLIFRRLTAGATVAAAP